MGKRSVITSEEILEQAYQLACEQGLRSLNIRSIAAACDVSVGRFTTRMRARPN